VENMGLFMVYGVFEISLYDRTIMSNAGKWSSFSVGISSNRSCKNPPDFWFAELM